jgi:hypothetical protein
LSSGSEVSKNDQAWKELFEKYGILEKIKSHGYYEITAAQINHFREARLMTKFDHKSNLPKLFADNALAILPITRGSYLISSFEAYKDFETIDTKIRRAALPEYLESIDYKRITSEAMAINCAHASNMLADFLEDEELTPTVSGRMSSESFSFDIWNTALNQNVAVNVANSQLEIDGGYEGIDQLALIEAKNALADDFLIRQLYYPYRLWKNKISKKIIPVFLVYSNGVFSLYEYQFQNPNNYNSLVLVKQKNYSIEAVAIRLDDLVSVLGKIQLIAEPSVAFPQADNLKRVINLCELLAENEMDRDGITLNYDFDPRQTNYYTDAARYLGLVSKFQKEGKVYFGLTEEGQKIIRSQYQTRQLKFVAAILRHKVFYKTFQLYLQKSEMPLRKDIINIMKEAHLYNVEAESTYYRRASTIISWIEWILDLQRYK